jgi:hypothetical protein
MRGVPRRLVLVGCFLVSILGTSAARAGGGGTVEGETITFVGAIVEPTCSVARVESTLTLAVSAAQKHQPLQQNCSDPAIAGTAAGARRPYVVNIVHLSGSESDQVLRYFANYARVAQPSSADPVLVTQTYE